MKKHYLIFILTILSLAVHAQQLPVYSQYFNNPYIYNPAYAGSQHAAYMYLNHRTQWVGFEGAPVTSSFSFNTPVGRRVALGVNLYTDKRGLLKTSSALASFGYTVPLGYDHFLRFGISAGMGNNSIDFAQIDNIQDPAVLRLLSENIFLDGQFGINYQIKNLNLGFALPKLYETAVFSEDYFSELKVGKLKRYIFSGSYKIDLGPTSFLEPMAIYRMTEGLPDFIEGGMVLNLKEIIWLGGSYRMNYGATALFGFNIKDNISFGYAYEFATSQASTFLAGTHEVQLGVRLGKFRDPNRKKEPKPVKEPVVKEIKEVEEEIIETIEEPVEKPIEVTEKAIELPTQKTEELPLEKAIENKPIEVTVKKGKHPLELEKGHYVISGVFTHERNAQRYRDAIKDRDYPANYGYNSENKYFYVYVHSSDTKGETKDELLKYRGKHEFKDAWLLSVENDEIERDIPSIEQPVKTDMNDNREIKGPKGPKPDDLGYSLAFHEDPINIIVEQGQVLTVQKGDTPGDMERGYYVISAVYKENDKAQAYSDRLFKEGINSKVGYNSEKNYFYIYLVQSDSEDKAEVDRIKFSQNDRLKDAWILEVE